ncbi:MAG: hypothetical protein GX022_03970 [Clostridiaceae bacterium]|nr:hypothetical protein [Clostridiaceae bacterium]
MKKFKKYIIAVLIFIIMSYPGFSRTNKGFALSLQAPKNLSVTVNQNYNELTWENGENPNVTTYIIIERSVDKGEFSQLTLLSGSRVSYKDYSVSNGHVYTYRLQTVYSQIQSIKSPYTPEVEAVNLYPINFRIANTFSDHVDLEWEYPILSVKREPGYQLLVERRKSNQTSWSVIAELPVTETAFRDTTVEPDTQYYYRARIRFDNEKYSTYIPSSSGASTRTGYPLITPLWGYGESDKTIRLMWDIPDSFEGTVILERKDASGDFITLYSGRGKSYRDTGRTPGETYTYRLCMRSKNGQKSEYTEEVKITAETVPVPSDLSVKAIASDKIIVTWTYRYDNETGFEIWRKGEGTWELLATVPKNSEIFTDGSASYGKSYTYMVRAKRGDYCYSSFTQSQTVINEYPEDPGPLQAYIINGLLYILSDKTPEGITYTLEFRTGINSPWSEIKTVKDGTLFTSIGFNKDSEYYFRIRASSGNLSSTGPELRFFGSAPEAPLNLEAVTVGYNRVTLKWLDQTDKEERYDIYRTIKGVRKLIGSVDKDTETFVDKYPVTGEDAYYEVVACNITGASPAAGIHVKIPKIIIFRDIESYEWAYDAIYTLQGMGVFDNIQNEYFYPSNAVTRGQMVQMVLRSFNINHDYTGLFPPAYMTPNHKYYKDMATAINLGLIHPDPGGRVYPNEAATRKDIILLLSGVLGHLGYPLNQYGTEHIMSFNDFWQLQQEDIEIVASFVGDGIISGKAGNVLDLNSNATRVEAAVFIYRTLLKYKIN